jgi:hypothetical protein
VGTLGVDLGRRWSMARDFGFAPVVEHPGETDDGRTQTLEPDTPVLWISHKGFLRATGEELRTPDRQERLDRLMRGLGSLDNDFPRWLEAVEGETEDGLLLRFETVESVRNVASKLRDRGLGDR